MRMTALTKYCAVHIGQVRISLIFQVDPVNMLIKFSFKTAHSWDNGILRN